MPLAGCREVSLYELSSQCGGQLAVADELCLNDRFGNFDGRGVGRRARAQVDTRAGALDRDAFNLGLSGEDEPVWAEPFGQAAPQPVGDVVLTAEVLAVR